MVFMALLSLEENAIVELQLDRNAKSEPVSVEPSPKNTSDRGKVQHRRSTSVSTYQLQQNKEDKRENRRQERAKLRESMMEWVGDLDPRTDPLTKKSRVQMILRIKILMLMIIVGLLAFIFWQRAYVMFQSLLQWVSNNPFLGGFALVGTYSVVTVFCIPGTVLAVGGGYAYYLAFGSGGLPLACLFVWLGAVCGAVFAFWVGRYLFRDFVERIARRNLKFQFLKRMSVEHGLKIATLVRLSAGIPFVATNYVFGSTDISLKDYTIALIAMFPWTLMYVLVGSSISEFAQIKNANSQLTKSKSTLIFLIIGAIVTLAASVFIAIFSRRQFRAMLATMQNNNECCDDTEIISQSALSSVNTSNHKLNNKNSNKVETDSVLIQLNE